MLQLAQSGLWFNPLISPSEARVPAYISCLTLNRHPVAQNVTTMADGRWPGWAQSGSMYNYT